jgi:predicted phage-related endonuclease
VEHKSFNVLEGGGLRPDVEAQVQWQLYCTDLPCAWITGLIGRSFVWRLVERDEDDIRWLVAIAKAFRERHLLPGIPPAATAADLGTLGRVPADPDEVVELDAETLRTIDALREAKDELDAVKRRVRALEAQVKAALGNASAGTYIGAPVVTWKQSTRKEIDAKALEQDHPEIAAKYRRATEVRTFRLVHVKTSTNRREAA